MIIVLGLGYYGRRIFIPIQKPFPKKPFFVGNRFAPNNKNTDLVNEKITFPVVLVIDQNQKQLGQLKIREALTLAQQSDLDLLCVAPSAKVPVCKILDYGKWKFEQTKKAKEAKKNQTISKLKEVKISPLIGIGDLTTKAKQASGFLSDGNKVHLTLKFKGRQIVHQSLGFQTIDKFLDLVKEFGIKDSEPKLNKKFIEILINPIKKGK